MTKKKKLGKLVLPAVAFCAAAAIFGGIGLGTVQDFKANAAESSEAVKKFYTAYNSFQEEQDAAYELNEELAGESFVLMKNRNNALPLKSSERKVTAFGIGSAYNSWGAQGSGTQTASAFQTLVSFKDGLANAGIKVNPGVLSFYEDAAAEGGASGGFYDGAGGATTSKGRVEYEPKPEELSSLESSFALYDDAAIMVITREGGEGEENEFSRTNYYDGTTKTADDAYAHALMLTPNERATLAYAEEHFDKVIVLINSTNPLELGVLEDDDNVDAVLWIGAPGISGFNAVGKTLTGEINPSGRTADIYPANLTQDPTWFNYGDQSGVLSTDDTLEGVAGEASMAYDENGNPVQMGTTTLQTVTYGESIYMGYRWYETQDELGNYYTNTNMPNNSSATYDTTDPYYNRDNGVVYPFGFGMSYTTFAWSDYSATLNAEDRTITVGVTITNTGSVAGKEVVQIYYKDPYIDGQIEKASANLVQFAKTEELAPGESEVVTITFDVKDMASFDYNDANNNGHKNYELDAGDYVISARSDSHTVKAEESIHLDAYVYDGSDEEHNYNAGYGENSEAIYSSTDKSSEDWLYNTYGDPNVQSYISRAGGTLAQPEAVINARYNADWVERMKTYQDYTAADAEEYNQKYNTFYVTDDGLPDSWTQATDTSADTAIQLSDMIGIDYPTYEYDSATNTVTAGTDEATRAWDEFLNQLSLDELVGIVGSDHGSSSARTRFGLPQSYCNDGSSKFQDKDAEQADLNGVAYDGTWWCSEVNVASTYNTDLVYQQGLMIGNESLYMNVTGIWGFGLNIHRGAWGARAFEYYSEDAVLTGYIVAAATKGCVEMGMIVYNKHFAMNDQDSYRNTADGLCVFSDEQAMRQNYLRAYEIAVKKGGANGAMSSFTRVGVISADNNYNLLTKTLRGEWGFEGDVCTDAGGGYCGDACIQAGNDWPLMNFTNAVIGEWDAQANNVVVEGEVNSTQYYAIRSCAMRILWVRANSNAMQNLVNTDAFVGSSSLTANNGREAENLSVVADFDSLNAQSVKYELKSGSLPQGLTLEKNGTISGTPTEIGTFTFTVRMTADNYVISEEEFTLTVNKLFQASNLTGTVGDEDFECIVSSDYVFVGSDYQTVVYSATGLPEGLSMAEDGTIYGTPTEAGSFDIDVTVVATAPNTVTPSGESAGSSSTYRETFTLVIADEGGAQTPADPTQEAIEGLQGSVDELQGTIDELEGTIAQQQGTIADQQTTIESLQAQIADGDTDGIGPAGVTFIVCTIVIVVALAGTVAVVLYKRKN